MQNNSTAERTPGSLHPAGSASSPRDWRWKPMDVAFGDNIRNPRRLILEVSEKYEHSRYTCCSESGGTGSQSDHSLRTLDEWLVWIDRFADDLTGREIREAKEAARAPFTEPKYWAEFRKRYADTGDPWLRETPNDKLTDPATRK